MPTISEPPVPPSAAGPLLVVDREELRLAGERGAALEGVVTLSNRGGVPLRGAVTVGMGAPWLRVAPALVHLAPGETLRVTVGVDPAAQQAGAELTGSTAVPPLVAMEISP
jgi:hypothetical protein